MARGRQSLVRRLTWLGMAVVAAALGLSLLLLGFLTSYVLRDQQQHVAEQAATLLADNLSPALAFDDRRAAEGVLRGFAGRTDLRELQVWSLDGTHFAQWQARGVTPRAWTGGGERRELNGDGLVLVLPVELKRERMGWLVWREGFDALQATQRRLLMGSLAVLALALVGAGLLLRWQQRRALTPLVSLSRLAERVAKTQDYSQRADVVHRDEVGRLAERFNDLLRRIEVWHRDLHEQLQQEQRTGRQLHQQAHRDALTGLANRLSCEVELERMLVEAQRSQRAAALLFLDLDGFKSVNDQLGHAAGDAVLKEVAQRLGAALRSDDLLCRLGGDEFALLVPEVQETVRVEQLAGRLVDALRMPLNAVEGKLPVGASIGVAFFPQHGRDSATLMAAADAAMYAAKRAGKNTFRVATEVESDPE